MRVYLLWFVIAVFCVFAVKDWFKPVPFLILLMPIYGHPDMPSGALGIQGLNPWNVLFLIVALCYLFQKTRDRAKWDLDGYCSTLLVIYVLAIIVSCLRLLADQSALEPYGIQPSTMGIVSEFLFNPLKFMGIAYLVFVGARTAQRRKLVLWAIIAGHLLVALLVIRYVPISAVKSADLLDQIALKVLQSVFSWSRVNTAAVLAGGAWAVLFSTHYLLKGRSRLIAMGLFGVLTIALALTGGRMGYGTWAALGGIFAMTKWKKGLLAIPALILCIVTIVPETTDRLLQGTSEVKGDLQIDDMSTVTSGRIVAWPIVIDRIQDSVLIGYGGLAMIRTGAMTETGIALGLGPDDRGFPHPHNAYLSLFLDTGIIGGIPILLFWVSVVRRSMKISGDVGSEEDAIGMTTLCLTLALLVSGIGSQYFYPAHSYIALWASIALCFRIYVDRNKHVASGQAATQTRTPARMRYRV